MTVVTVDDLHRVPDPAKRIERAASIAGVRAGSDKSRIIVRAPDRASDGIRVLQLGDVASLLMDHARIREIGVTPGGTIVAAADVCRRRGHVAVWTGQAIGPWHPSDITQRGLGGSETAAVRLAEQFAEMGFVTTLYGHFADEGICGDVMLRKFDAYDPSAPLDALIGFRAAQLFDRRPTGPRFCALWLEDLAPAEGLTRGNAANIDRVYTVTHWHKQQLLDAHPWLRARQVGASRNGIVHRYFESDALPEREHRVIYSSSPDRGGDIMLEIWPQVREQVPDAELVLTYSRWFDLVAGFYQSAHNQLARIRELLEQPGVSRIEGGLGQKDLAHLMRTASVWAHPSWYTEGKSDDGTPGREFHETSCISAMEAQAAGCVVVASNWGALTETVMHGTLVDGDPREKEGVWRKVFVDSIVRGLTDPVIQEAAQSVGPEMVRDMDWRGPAEQVAGAFAMQGVEHPIHHPV